MAAPMVVVFIWSLLLSSVRASTHWVVTEEGKVQEQLESAFVIKQPHDLVAFMKQEKNFVEMRKIKEVLMVEKKDIEDNEDKQFDLEEKHYKKDEDCKAAGQQLGDFDLFVSSVLPIENKDIQVSDLIDFSNPETGTYLLKPDCAKYYDLQPSEKVYDYLEGVKNREYLHSYQAESGLKTTMKYMENENELANAINDALKKNSTSWVAYNIATLYWRMKGDAEKAIECVRRALHFSPNDYKDVALVNLANVLHRSRYSTNASTVLEDALEISSLNVIHFTLGSIYAALGEFVPSISHYEKTLKGQPEFGAAKKRLNAVKCQYKLQLKLEAQHESLQRTLRELEAYQEKHKKYIEIYQNIEKLQLTRQEQINMHFLLMQFLIKEGKFDHKLCKVRSHENGPVMFCNLPKADQEKHDDDLVPNINSGTKSDEEYKSTQGDADNSEASVKTETNQGGKTEKAEEDRRGHISNAQPTNFASGLNAGTFQQPENVGKIDFSNWHEQSWPSEEICSEHAPRTLAWDEYPSTYINPESRGFSVRDLLTTYIEIEEGENLPKPWTELNCESLEPVCEKSSIDKIQGVADRHSAPMHKKDDYMLRELLLHLNEGRVWPGDIAHRIQAAIKKSLSRKDKNLWLLYNFAGLYFRVQGDNLKAVECIRRAAHRTPAEQYDIPLVNLANIMYRLGKVNDALTLLIEALGINQTEPITYLAVGNALHAKGNSTGAATFYKYGIFLNPQYKEDLYALLNSRCAAIREKKLHEKMNIETTNDDEEAEDCQVDSSKCSFGSPPTSSSSLGHAVSANLEQIYRTEERDDGTEMYTVHTFSSHECQLVAVTERGVTTDCDNVSDKNDLVQRLETTKENADKILHDADNVIQRLSHVAKDSAEELSLRVSSARQIMQQLSQMRDNLGTLVEEASSTLDTVSMQTKPLLKTDLMPSSRDCAHFLHSVDLRSYLSSNTDVSARGYDFTEELPSLGLKTTSGSEEPYCDAPTSPAQYNVDHLKSVINRDSYMKYDEEYGMEILLKQTISSDEEISTIVQQLSKGIKQHPTSWKLAFLSSYYWRLKGRAKEAIDCLRLSLSTAPLEMRDVVLLGLANVFAQLSQWKDAIHVTNQAILLYPDYFLYHFTKANILAAMGDIRSSIPVFKRTLDLQPTLEIAKRRIQAAICEDLRAGPTGVH
ncbi:tetratricopeptide repeat protein 17-like isoform X2 [Styela clava]